MNLSEMSYWELSRLSVQIDLELFRRSISVGIAIIILCIVVYLIYSAIFNK